MLRPSGTEPIVRLYAESKNPQKSASSSSLGWNHPVSGVRLRTVVEVCAYYLATALSFSLGFLFFRLRVQGASQYPGGRLYPGQQP